MRLRHRVRELHRLTLWINDHLKKHAGEATVSVMITTPQRQLISARQFNFYIPQQVKK